MITLDQRPMEKKENICWQFDWNIAAAGLLSTKQKIDMQNCEFSLTWLKICNFISNNTEIQHPNALSAIK